MAARLLPPVMDPAPAEGVGDGVGHGLVAADAAGVSQQRVCAVEQPELALLERREVVDDLGARLLPSRPSGRERPAEDPLGERLGDDGGRVCHTRGCQDTLAVLRRRLRRDPVDHGGDPRDVAGDPLGQGRVDEFSQLRDHP